MSKFASLHSGMLVRAQIGNGGFVADNAGATPNIAQLATTTDPTPCARQPRPGSADIHSRSSFSPPSHKRAEVLPPGSIGSPAAPVAAATATATATAAAAPTSTPRAMPFGAVRSVASSQDGNRFRGTPEKVVEVRRETPKTPWSRPVLVSAEATEKPAPRPRKSMTLRLAHEQHKALKLASIRLDRTCQDIMATAVQQYLQTLDTEPEDTA